MEFLSQNCPKWYTFLAIINALSKKKEKISLENYIVSNEGYKVWTSRFQYNLTAKYFEQTNLISRINSETKDIETVTKLADQMIKDLTKLTNEDYNLSDCKNRTFIFKDNPVKSDINFLLLFNECCFITPREIKPSWTFESPQRIRSSSSPPELESPLRLLANTAKNCDSKKINSKAPSRYRGISIGIRSKQ